MGFKVGIAGHGAHAGGLPVGSGGCMSRLPDVSRFLSDLGELSGRMHDAHQQG